MNEFNKDNTYLKMVLGLILMAIVTLISATWALSIEKEYSREYFQHWVDADGDGLDTRQEMLIDDAVRAGGVPLVEVLEGKVVKGVWVCPYSGFLTEFPGELDVDHVVPLSWAWRHGASEWDDGERREFANDHENLMTVKASVNRAKGDKGPDEWIPPNLAAVESYILTFQAVCKKYEMTGCNFPLELEKYSKTKNGVKP